MTRSRGSRPGARLGELQRRVGIAGAVAQGVEAAGQIVEAVGDDVDDALLALQFAGAAQQGRAQRGAAEALEDLRPDDQVGDPGLVLDGDENDAVGAPRPLPDQHDPGDRKPAVDRQTGKIGGGDQTLAGELGAQKGQRMALQAEAEAAVILDDVLAERHLREQRHGARFAGLVFSRGCFLPSLSPHRGEGRGEGRNDASSGEAPLTLPSRPKGRGERAFYFRKEDFSCANSGSGASSSALTAHKARRRSSPVERKASASARRSSAPRPSPLCRHNARGSG